MLGEHLVKVIDSVRYYVKYNTILVKYDELRDKIKSDSYKKVMSLINEETLKEKLKEANLKIKELEDRNEEK